MFMFNTKKLHSFIQNYITIIARMELKHKSYIFHIKMSQVKKTYHLYKSNMYIFIPFLHFEAHKCRMDILFYDFHMYSYWNFVIL